MKKILNKLIEMKEVILYLVFGVLTTLVYFIIYTVCTRVILIDIFTSSVIAWIIAVTFAYITNKAYVFESKNLSTKMLIKEISAFFIARIFSLVVDISIMYIGVNLLFIFDMYVKLVSQVFVVLMNYLLSKFLIFKKEDHHAES